MPPVERAVEFSVHRAFVMQFYDDTQIDAGRLTGRIEHVVTGQAMVFESLETLLGFVARVLHTVHTPTPPIGP